VKLNTFHKLHTTRSWDFLGLDYNQPPQQPGLLQKAKYGEDVIIGVIDSGLQSQLQFKLKYMRKPNDWTTIDTMHIHTFLLQQAYGPNHKALMTTGMALCRHGGKGNARQARISMPRVATGRSLARVGIAVTSALRFSRASINQLGTAKAMARTSPQRSRAWRCEA
jgi:hypothetical protein